MLSWMRRTLRPHLRKKALPWVLPVSGSNQEKWGKMPEGEKFLIEIFWFTGNVNVRSTPSETENHIDLCFLYRIYMIIHKFINY